MHPSSGCNRSIELALQDWRKRSVPSVGGTPAQQIKMIEAQKKVELPDCLFHFYELTDGPHGAFLPKPEQADLYQILPLNDLYRPPSYDDLLIFCDYMLSSLFFGIGITKGEAEFAYGKVYRVLQPDSRAEKYHPKKVADSFEEFLLCAIRDSSEDLLA